MTYLRHQLRLLRGSHSGELKVVHDTLPGQEPYGRVRARLQSDTLWRAYELLCPRDHRHINTDVLSLTGWPGFVALWIDRGLRRPASAVLPLTRHWPRRQLLEDWLEGLGCPGEIRLSNAGTPSIHWPQPEARALMKRLRQDVHASRRVCTWPRQGRQWDYQRVRD